MESRSHSPLVVSAMDNFNVPKMSQRDHNSVNRRTGNYHPNLWNDDLIQSLSSPFGASSYRDRVEILIREMKDIIFDGDVTQRSPYQLLCIVDVLGRLGIDRHFQTQIKAALDYTYEYWSEKGISWEGENGIAHLNITALGFRILRLNGYHVSPDVFHNFKDEKGQFFCAAPTEEEGKLRSMLNLYRASEVCFPGERIMKEANVVASEYLQEALKELNGISQMLMEVEYVLKYPWRCSLPRWEAWNFIQIYRQDSACLDDACELQNGCGIKLLELAILDFNILQAQHQDEMKLISRWWKESNAEQLNFFRHRPLEYYFLMVSGLFEPNFSASRIGFAKLCSMLTLLDDIYDTYGTIDELKPFTVALIRWDRSMIAGLPEYMKTSFEFAHKTLGEIAIEAEKKHGPCVRKYMQDYWESYILAYLQEAKWIATKYMPSFDEYLETAVISVAVPMVSMHPLILMDTFLADDILEKIKKFESLVSRATRFLDDSRDFQDEKERGEDLSCIECYVKDNPGSTRGEALNHINTLLDCAMEELKRSFSCRNNYQLVPRNCISMAV